MCRTKCRFHVLQWYSHFTINMQIVYINAMRQLSGSIVGPLEIHRRSSCYDAACIQYIIRWSFMWNKLFSVLYKPIQYTTKCL